MYSLVLWNMMIYTRASEYMLIDACGESEYMLIDACGEFICANTSCASTPYPKRPLLAIEFMSGLSLVIKQNKAKITEFNPVVLIVVVADIYEGY